MIDRFQNSTQKVVYLLSFLRLTLVLEPEQASVTSGHDAVESRSGEADVPQHEPVLQPAHQSPVQKGIAP